MATFTNNFYGGGKGYNLCLDIIQNSQNVANNTSNVTVTVRLVSLGSSYTINSSTSKDGSVTIDGTKYTFTFTAGLKANQNKTLYTKTLDITHGSDGTKTLSVSATCYLGVTLSGISHGNTTVSGSTVLTTIPRTTPVSISGSGTFGSSKWIGHSRASSAFTVTLRYSCGSASGTIVSRTTANETWWTPPKSLQEQIPKATNITITVYCDTYSGNTLIGTTSTSFTCYIASDCVPTINGCQFMNGENHGTSYYQGVNTVRLVADVSGAYGSTVVKFDFTIDGKTKTNYGYIMYTDIVYTSGYKDIKMTITDSRGKTATKTWTSAVYFTAYTRPQITNFTCKRMGYDDNDNLVISNLGTVGYFTASGSFHSNSTSQSRKFMYKPANSESWTTINLSNQNYTDYLFSSSLATGSAYDLKFVMTDNITSTEMQIKMQNVYPLINMNAAGNAIAFGKECNTDNKFMVSMDASFNNNTKIYDLEVTGEALCNNIPLKIVTSNGTGTYYGNQIWLNECLAISSTGSGGILYLNSAGNHQWVDIHGSLSVRGRGGNNQIMMVETQGDGNGDGDGKTHIGYYDSGLGGYSHYFRGGGKTYINTYYGLYVSKDVTVGQYLRSDWLGYTSNSGWDGNWGIGASCHIYPTTTARYLGSSAHRWHSAYLVSAPNVSSDARNKENVKYMYDQPDVISEFTDVKENDEITTRDLLDFVLNDLHMVTFDYKQSTEGMEQGEIDMITSMNNRQIGFIAQDIENTKVGKYLVSKDKDGILGYESSNWPSIIAGALQQEIRDRQASDKELKDMLNDIINE